MFSPRRRGASRLRIPFPLLGPTVTLMAVTAAVPPAIGAVVLNEIGARSTERLLRDTAAGTRAVGAGVPWWNPGFDDRAWPEGPAPMGFGIGTVATNLSSAVRNRTPSLYARHTFESTPALAEANSPLVLKISFTDGYVAYLNGHELGRAHLGAPGGHVAFDQPSFNPIGAGDSPVTAVVPDASQVLVPGTNVLAVQVHNDSVGSGSFGFEASLTAEEAVLHTPAFEDDFADANGASRTHQNLGGTVDDSATGTPVPGGWLDRSPAVASDPGWSSLTIITESDPAGGPDGSGAIAYTLTAEGDPHPATIALPAIDMSGLWAQGAVTMADLDQTVLTFDFHAPLGSAFGVSVANDAVPGAVMHGLPPLTPAAPAPSTVAFWRFDDPGAADGSPVVTAATSSNSPALDAHPAGPATYSGDIPGPFILDPLTGAAYQNTHSLDLTAADARLEVPDSALLNTASFTLECFLKIVGEPLGYDPYFRRSAGSGNALDSTLTQWQIDFDHSSAPTAYGSLRSRWDLPGSPPPDYFRVVPARNVWTDYNEGATSYGSGDPFPKGDGINDNPAWHHFALRYDGETNRVTSFTDGVQGGTITLNGTFAHAAAPLEIGKLVPTEYAMFIDEVRYSARALEPNEFLVPTDTPPGPQWRTFTVSLGQAPEPAKQAFLDALNGGGETTFRPRFEVLPESVSETGTVLTIDNFRASRAEVHFESDLVSNGSGWRYFPGLIEPSGGLSDPGLLTTDLSENRFADWIELRNTDAQAAADLSGWSLSDDPDEPTKWVFPQGATIPPDGYLVVVADGLGDVPGATFLHTNFKLSGDGEFLGLYAPGGALADSFAPRFPGQDAFHSFGRPPGAPFGAPLFIGAPSPGSANAGPALDARVAPPVFSHGGGFYDSTVTLALSCETPGATIRFTTDGTEPTATHGAVYTVPLTLSTAGSRKGRCLRARAFLDGHVPSEVRTHTYLIGADSRLRGKPALCFTADLPRSLYSPHGVLAIEGGSYPSSTWVPGGPDTYNMLLSRGRAFERPLAVEYYLGDGTAGFRTEAGVRAAASDYSRPRMRLNQLGSNPWPSNAEQKPSFNLHFRGDYGNESVRLPLLGPDYPVQEFAKLRPRAGKNDINNPFIIDELVRRLLHDMGQESALGVFNSLWVNGDFKGFYNTCERLRSPFFAHHHHTDPEGEWDVRQVNDFAEGTSSSWDNLLGRLNQNPASQANWEAVREVADVENLADYFLLNIYTATWDWPQNNWVGARERAQGGKWRCYVWDAEGGFNNRGNKPVNHTTIDSDLDSQSSALARLWQGLVRSPEFRLVFADRIHRHLFRGGPLDDRNYATSNLKRRTNELVAEFEPLLRVVHGSAVNTSKITDWTSPSNGRRTYLLGPNRHDFRTNGLWPNTSPVAFGQDGGDVPAGYALPMTHDNPGNVTLYFTTDGSDPRAFGGTVAGGASTYSGAVPLRQSSTTVMARARHSSTGEWSALTEASFVVGAVPATPANLVVAELHYHPRNPSPAEAAAAGTSDADDFEFVQLANVGSDPVDLREVRFVTGITFDFESGDVPVLDPGARVLVVNDRAAFYARYGDAFDALIAGVYDGNLRNSGELVRLERHDRTTIHEFTYGDGPPWPSAPDGAGFSLVLRNLGSPSPDHSEPQSWTAAAQVDGLPGGTVVARSFDEWRSLVFSPADAANDAVSSPDADIDGDGLSTFLEFVLGTSPTDRRSGPDRLPTSSVGSDAGGTSVSLTVRTSTGAEAAVAAESSADLGAWTTGPPEVVPDGPPEPAADGTTTYRFRSAAPGGTCVFLRARFEAN